MDWPRSEDLKEEKVVTTPMALYHVGMRLARARLTCRRPPDWNEASSRGEQY